MEWLRMTILRWIFESMIGYMNTAWTAPRKVSHLFFVSYCLLYGVPRSHLLQYHPGKRTLLLVSNLALFTNQGAFIRSFFSYSYSISTGILSIPVFDLSLFRWSLYGFNACCDTICFIHYHSPFAFGLQGHVICKAFHLSSSHSRDKERMRIVLDNVN